jgi:hypothetical protein
MAISTVRKGRDEARAGARPSDVVNVWRSALARPPQRRLRVASRDRIDELAENRRRFAFSVTSAACFSCAAFAIVSIYRALLALLH